MFKNRALLCDTQYAAGELQFNVLIFYRNPIRNIYVYGDLSQQKLEATNWEMWFLIGMIKKAYAGHSVAALLHKSCHCLSQVFHPPNFDIVVLFLGLQLKRENRKEKNEKEREN